MSDPEIVDFFQKTMLDPHRFMLHSIKNYNKKLLSADDIQVVVGEQNGNIVLKQSLVETLQKASQLLSKLSFHESERVLSPYCATMASDAQIHVCQICNAFRVTTKKGLAAHQRKCGKAVTGGEPS